MYDDGIEQEITCDSYEDCKKKLYDVYGEDYEIHDKKLTLSRGFLGFGQKEQVTVKYVVKERVRYASSNSSGDFLRRSAQQLYNDEEELRLEENRQAILQQQTSTLMNAQISALGDVDRKIEDLAQAIKNLDNKSKSPDTPEAILKIEELLERNEFSYSYIKMITDKIRQTFSLDQLENFDLIERTVVDWIGESISIAQKKTVRPPRVVVIVGPTGVGKTTTLVKLATTEIVSAKKTGEKHEARLITTDVTRVGAMEQLEHFGEILHRDVKKAENVDDLKEVFTEYKDHCDAIYIDTSGYSPNDSENIGKMKSLLDVPGLSPEMYLAFDAKTKSRDIANIIKNYEPFGYNAVIVTKCDESEQYGNVISALYEKHKSIAYITDGQNAARNIIPANVIYFLTRLEGFNIDRAHIEEKFQYSEGK